MLDFEIKIASSFFPRYLDDSASYGTHSMRRTKATQIYRKTGNPRVVRRLLGPTKLESTVRYLDGALHIAEQIEI